MGERESGGCGAGLALLIAGGAILSMGGGVAFFAAQRRYAEEQVALEKMRVVAEQSQAQAQREAALERERAKEAEAKRAAADAAQRERERAQVEELSREDAARAAATGPEAAPGVHQGVEVVVFLPGQTQGTRYVVREVQGTRARCEPPNAGAPSSGAPGAQVWIDFAQVPRYDVLSPARKD
ncbi:MAG: hypothetical protein AB7N76_32965 [Planctomycetota bacterium]